MPQPKRAKIYFQYFEVCCIDEEDRTERLFPLEDWIHDIHRLPLQERIVDGVYIKGRVDEIRMTYPREYYALDFMRMDEVSDAYKVTEEDRASHIGLDEDEYMGRSTAAIYDSQNHILMIQRNRGGYCSKSIETYINATSGQGLCYLRAILNILEANECMRNRVAKIDVRFANIRDFRPGRSAAFEQIVEAMNSTEGLTGHIEIGMGYNRNETLAQETVCEMIEDIRANRGSVSSAKIVLDDYTSSAIIDLFDNVENDTLIFTLPIRGELGFGERSDRMDERYTESRNRILRALMR